MQFNQKIYKAIIVIALFTLPIVAKDFVLLVGVGEFKSSKLFTPFNISNDIADIKEVLIKYKLGKDYDIIELINSKATKHNILSTFRDIANRATKNDRIFFYYTGHGTAYTDSSIWKYIRRLDREDRNFLENTSAIIPYDFDENNIRHSMIIGSEDFAPILDIIDSKSSAVIMLDACFSSLMARGERLKAYFTGEKKKNYKNITIISNTNRTSSRNGRSNMTSLLSKCLKKRSYRQCLKNSSSIRVK
jgi:hypothetical protein